MNYLYSTLFVFTTLVSVSKSHCRYDMNLEYFELQQIQAQISTGIKSKLHEIVEQDRDRMNNKHEFFVHVVSKDINITNYSKALDIKKKVVKNNINNMIAKNCKQVAYEVTGGQILGEGNFGQVVLAKGNIIGDNISYSDYGASIFVVKKMKNKPSQDLSPLDNFYKYLSDISKEVRAGACLYDIFNYDFDGDKYDDIRHWMIRRDQMMSGIVTNSQEPFSTLDSVSVINCQYYTPKNVNGSPTMPGKDVNITADTVFYLGMPKMEGNIEEFFFGKRTFFEQKQAKGIQLGYNDDFRFRVSMCKKMIQAVKNIHVLGFINKDIKPENFLYIEHKTYTDQYNLVISLADFGLAGIDDYNTFQYSDLAYRPNDNLTEMNKELDVYQMGLSVFQIMYNMPKAHMESRLSLQILNNLAKPATMAALLGDYHRGNTNSINTLKLQMDSQQCLLEIVKRIYDGFQTYEFPIRNYSNRFDMFFYEIENVAENFANANFIGFTNTNGYKIAARSFVIWNYMDIDRCSRYSQINIDMSYIIFQSINPNPTKRISSKNFYKRFKHLVKYMDSNENRDMQYYAYDVRREILI